MAEKPTIAEHTEYRTLKDFLIDPDHAKREGESAEFDRSVKRLKEDGHYKCRVSGSTENLQVHHFGCEWMFENIVDYDKLKTYLEEHDIYGYSRLLKNQPITSVDDIRNLEVLSQPYHTGVDHENNNSGIGVHDLSEPSFNIQIVCLDGADPIPQPGETFAQTLERIKKFERK